MARTTPCALALLALINTSNAQDWGVPQYGAKVTHPSIAPDLAYHKPNSRVVL